MSAVNTLSKKSEEQIKNEDELVRIGWVTRDSNGNYDVTEEGRKAYLSIRRKQERERAQQSMIPRARQGIIN